LTTQGTRNCDAQCPAEALVFVGRLGLELAFCGHCFDNRWADLFANGWGVRSDIRPALRSAEDQRR